MNNSRLVRSWRHAGLFAATLAATNGWASDAPVPVQATECDNWAARRLTADYNAMQQLAGAWEASYPDPERPDRRIRTVMTNYPDGIFMVERWSCPAGEAGDERDCQTSTIAGEWVARFGNANAIAALTWSSGTGFGGEPIPMTCAVSYFWRVDEGVLIDLGGTPHRRVE